MEEQAGIADETQSGRGRNGPPRGASKTGALGAYGQQRRPRFNYVSAYGLSTNVTIGKTHATVRWAILGLWWAGRGADTCGDAEVVDLRTSQSLGKVVRARRVQFGLTQEE